MATRVTCHVSRHVSTLVLAAGEGTLAVGEEPEDEVEHAEAEADEGGGAVHRGHQEAHQQHGWALLVIFSHFRQCFLLLERGFKASLTVCLECQKVERFL